MEETKHEVNEKVTQLRPIEKVSVEKSALSRPSWKRISTTSFRIGSKPPW